jgi:mannonate dehydratase
LKDPKNDIYPIIKWVGERNQIFNVHLRNIKGSFNNFQEVYPDNGEMDFVKVIRALRDVGYSGMVMPDHVPHHHDPARAYRLFHFATATSKVCFKLFRKKYRLLFIFYHKVPEECHKEH